MGLLGTATTAVSSAVATAATVAGAAERTMWSLVRTRLDAVAPPPPRAALHAAPEPRFAPSPRSMMADLLSTSLEHDALSSEREYLVALLRQLLPDEARIIAALADGPPAPTVSVYRRGSSDLLRSHASLIGRQAAVTLPSRTTRYVAHLLHLGLVELGPEDKGNEVGYELVLADREVRPALREGALGKLPARVERRTLRLSEHGRALWEATRPDAPPSPAEP